MSNAETTDTATETADDTILIQASETEYRLAIELYLFIQQEIQFLIDNRIRKTIKNQGKKKNIESIKWFYDNGLHEPVIDAFWEDEFEDTFDIFWTTRPCDNKRLSADGKQRILEMAEMISKNTEPHRDAIDALYAGESPCDAVIDEDETIH